MLCSQTKVLLESFVTPNDLGIWSLFSVPQHTAELYRTAGAELNLVDYDIVAGTEVLGAALAFVLAYHDFSGHLALLRPEYGLLPPPTDWSGKRAMLCQGRLEYGTYAIDAYEEARDAGAVVDTFLFGCVRGKWGMLPSHLRQTSIRKLVSEGVRLVTLC